MSTIWEITKSALTGLGVPLAADVYIPASGVDFPDLYLVYFLVTSPPEQSADDAETLRSYLVQVSTYSRDGMVGLPDVAGAMVAAGFERSAMRHLPYNNKTRHFGLAEDFIYLGV